MMLWKTPRQCLNAAEMKKFSQFYIYIRTLSKLELYIERFGTLIKALEMNFWKYRQIQTNNEIIYGVFMEVK